MNNKLLKLVCCVSIMMPSILFVMGMGGAPASKPVPEPAPTPKTSHIYGWEGDKNPCNGVTPGRNMIPVKVRYDDLKWRTFCYFAPDADGNMCRPNTQLAPKG